MEWEIWKCSPKEASSISIPMFHTGLEGYTPPYGKKSLNAVMDYVDISAHITWDTPRNAAASDSHRWGVFSVSATVDFEHKIHVYRQMSRALPGSFEAWSHLGYYLAQAGQYSAAIEAYARTLYIQARAPRIWYNYATILEKQGWYGEAVRWYGEALCWYGEALRWSGEALGG